MLQCLLRGRADGEYVKFLGRTRYVVIQGRIFQHKCDAGDNLDFW